MADTPLLIQKHEVKPSPIEYVKLNPYIGWVNQATIEKTFQQTTQWVLLPQDIPCVNIATPDFLLSTFPGDLKIVKTNVKRN